MACEKWCPDDYDAIRMVPFATVIKDREAYETATFSADAAGQEDRRLTPAVARQRDARLLLRASAGGPAPRVAVAAAATR